MIRSPWRAGVVDVNSMAIHLLPCDCAENSNPEGKPPTGVASFHGTHVASSREAFTVASQDDRALANSAAASTSASKTDSAAFCRSRNCNNSARDHMRHL